MTTFFLNLVFFCEKLGYPNLRTFMGCVMFLLYIPLRICFSPLVVYSLYAFWADFRRLPALYLSRAARVGVPGTRVVAARERLGAGPRRSCGTPGSARERTAPGRVAAPPRGADSSGGAATAGGRARSRGGALSESRGDAAGHRLRAGGSWS